MSIKLIATADLKAFLEISDSVTTFDTLLGSIINYISKWFETETDRSFKKESRTKYFSSGGKIFQLPAFPIDESLTLTVTFDDDLQVKDDDYYVWADEGVIEFVVDTAKTDPKQMVIVWSGGWTETSSVLAAPDDLKYACILQSAFEFRRRKDVGITSVTSPDGSKSIITDDLLPKVKNILNGYKI